MTLTEYLASPAAVEDVRAMLQMEPESGYVEMALGDHFLALDRDTPWDHISVGASESGPIHGCYYRSIENGIEISDLGESVSGIMRRTGKSWRDSCAAAFEVCPQFTPAAPDLLIIVTPGGLAEALVSALAAVAKCQGVG